MSPLHALHGTTAREAALISLLERTERRLILVLPGLPLTEAVRDALHRAAGRGAALHVLCHEPDPLWAAEAHQAVWAMASDLVTDLGRAVQLVLLRGPALPRISGLVTLPERRAALDRLAALPRHTPPQRAPELGARAHRAAPEMALALADDRLVLIEIAGHCLQAEDEDLAQALAAYVAQVWNRARAEGGALSPLCQPQIADRQVQSPHLVNAPDCAAAARHLCQSARDWLSLETRGLIDAALCDALCAQASHAPDLRLRLALPTAPVAPAYAPEGSAARLARHQAQSVARLAEAFGPRLTHFALPEPAPFALLTEAGGLLSAQPLTSQGLVDPRGLGLRLPPQPLQDAPPRNTRATKAAPAAPGLRARLWPLAWVQP